MAFRINGKNVIDSRINGKQVLSRRMNGSQYWINYVITTATLVYSFRKVAHGYTGDLCILQQNGVNTTLNSFQGIVSYLNSASSTVRVQSIFEQTGNGLDLNGNDIITLVDGYPTVQISTLNPGIYKPTGDFALMVLSDDGSSSIPLWGGSTDRYAFVSSQQNTPTSFNFGNNLLLYSGNTQITDTRDTIRTEILNQFKVLNYRNCLFTPWVTIKIAGYPAGGFGFNGLFRELILSNGEYENITTNVKNFYNL